jgi:hypothetical protein
MRRVQVKAWKAALAAAIASAAIALIVIAPLAQSSSKRHPGLKVVTVDSFGNGRTTANCPRGFIPIAGGFSSVDGNITHSFRSSRRGWQVELDNPTGGVTGIATCAKGTGGFKLKDAGER